MNVWIDNKNIPTTETRKLKLISLSHSLIMGTPPWEERKIMTTRFNSGHGNGTKGLSQIT